MKFVFSTEVFWMPCAMRYDWLCTFNRNYEKVLNCSYNPIVFILPPWKEIYQTDNERKQDWQEAEHTYFQMKSTYEKYGYGSHKRADR